MALATAAWGQDGKNYDGQDMRQIAADFIDSGLALTGAVMSGFKVSQQASPGSTVRVASGRVVISATGSGLGGGYGFWNDGSINSPAIDPTSTNGRKDRLILRVTNGVPALEVVKGTAAASPAEPSITGSNYIELALVTLPSSTTNVTDAFLTDRRYFGGRWAMPWGAGGIPSDILTSSAGSTGAFVDTDLSIAFTRVFNRQYDVVVTGHAISDVAGDVVALALRDGSNNVLDSWDVRVGGATVADAFSRTYRYVAPAAGSFTVKVSVGRRAGSGTCNVFADADRIGHLYISDVGPFGNPD